MTREEILKKNISIDINIFGTLERLGVNIDEFLNEFKDQYDVDIEEADNIAINDFLYDYFDCDTLSNIVKDIMITDVTTIELC